MKYATCMDHLVRFTDAEWKKFVQYKAGGGGNDKSAFDFGRDVGRCPNVTDWSKDDAVWEKIGLDHPNPR